jgi:Holliday junction resolvase RusA-like endonuclease
MKFTVPGEPRGKERPRFGKSNVWTPDKTAAYENCVKLEYRRQCGNKSFPAGVPLYMRVSAFYAIPGSASKSKQRDMESGLIRPVKKPDFDNIGKIVADSLNGAAYHDDAQIVDCQIQKFYSRDPRVEISISEGAIEND